MTQAGSALAVSAAVIALTLGVTGEKTATPRDGPPLSTSDIVIATEEQGSLPEANLGDHAGEVIMGVDEDDAASGDLDAMPESIFPDGASE